MEKGGWVDVERHDETTQAIVREKLVKKWQRAGKVALTGVENPDWGDLLERWLGAAPEES